MKIRFEKTLSPLKKKKSKRMFQQHKSYLECNSPLVMKAIIYGNAKEFTAAPDTRLPRH